MSIVTAALSALPLIGKLIDRFFPDKKGERAELRKAIMGTRAFQAALWVLIAVVVLEILLRATGWVWPQLGLPESIVTGLEYFGVFVLVFFGVGG